MGNKLKSSGGLSVIKSHSNIEYRARPTQSRAEKNVEKILEVTTELVAKLGVSDVTTSLIAETAEIPVGSVYRYFKNKESIFAMLAERHQEEKDAHFADYLPSNPEDMTSDEYVNHWVEALLVSLRSQPVYIETLRLAVRLPDHFESNRSSNERWKKAISHLKIFSDLNLPSERRDAFYNVYLSAGLAIMEMALLAEADEEYALLKEEMKVLLRSYIGYYGNKSK